MARANERSAIFFFLWAGKSVRPTHTSAQTWDAECTFNFVLPLRGYANFVRASSVAFPKVYVRVRVRFPLAAN